MNESLAGQRVRRHRAGRHGPQTLNDRCLARTVLAQYERQRPLKLDFLLLVRIKSSYTTQSQLLYRTHVSLLFRTKFFKKTKILLEIICSRAVSKLEATNYLFLNIQK